MRTDEAKVADTRLSYSSATLLKNCQQKYYFHKIAGTAKDPDYEENEAAFNLGKAFHWVLESNNHTQDRLGVLIDQAAKEFNVEEDKALLHGMLLRYLKLHLKSGLVVVHCEMEISNEKFVGYIDAIMKESNGGWWLVDLKTASRYSEITTAKLPKDVQLNLYSAFAKEAAIQFKLDARKFRGARYRVTTKSTARQKASEKYHEYVIRLANTVKSYDIAIPKKLMNPKETLQEHLEWHKFSMAMREGKVKPYKNLSYCDSYFRPCEFWSQCHGATYTECKSLLSVEQA